MVKPSAPPTGWVATITDDLASYLHDLGYGNLRFAHSTWEDGAERVANLAMVYEIPGGSTNQINVMFHEHSGIFAYLTLDTHEERQTASLDDVQAMVRESVARIPALRLQRLDEEIDRKAADGISLKALLDWLNGLLKFEDVYGGKITLTEMQHGIAHFRNHHYMKS